MARSEYWSGPLRLPTPAAAHVAIASGVSQRVTSPRRTRARSYSAQVPDAIRCRVLRMHSRLHIEIMTRRRSRWSTCRPLLAHRAESAHQRHGPRSPARDRTITLVKQLGRRRWKKTSGYHRQSRVENTFFRYKSIIGDGLRARSPAGQGSEVVLGCEILNRMTELGRPVSYRIGR